MRLVLGALLAMGLLTSCATTGDRGRGGESPAPDSTYRSGGWSDGRAGTGASRGDERSCNRPPYRSCPSAYRHKPFPPAEGWPDQPISSAWVLMGPRASANSPMRNSYTAPNQDESQG